jgi:hypothetical protein
MNGFITLLLTSTMTIALAGVAQGQTNAIHYRIAPEASGDRLDALAITLTITARVGEPLTLDLPSLVSGNRAAADLVLDGGDVEPAAADAQANDKLQVRATATTVTLHYRLHSDGSDSPLADQDNPQRSPAVRDFWFGLKGEQALALPEGLERTAATLDYDGVPAGWMVTTSISGPATVADMADTLMIGGRPDATRRRQHDVAPRLPGRTEGHCGRSARRVGAGVGCRMAILARAGATFLHRPGADEEQQRLRRPRLAWRIRTLQSRPCKIQIARATDDCQRASLTTSRRTNAWMIEPGVDAGRKRAITIANDGHKKAAPTFRRAIARSSQRML